MARTNLFDPAIEAKSSDGSRFKEGNIRVRESVFKVHQQKVPEGVSIPAPVFGLQWIAERLDEDLEPLTDDDGNPLVEVLFFSGGGKSLAQIHPGEGEGPSDDEPTDLGVEVDTEGNTIAIINPSFKLHEKSGMKKLLKSLKKAGWKDEFARMWAHDYVGLVAFIKGEVDEEVQVQGRKQDPKTGKNETYGVTYKVVDRIHTYPYEQTDKKKGARKPAASNAAETVAKELLAELSGTSTKKAVSSKIMGLLNEKRIDPKLHVPILTLVKDDKWLAKNAEVETDDDGKVLSVDFGE